MAIKYYGAQHVGGYYVYTYFIIHLTIHYQRICMTAPVAYFTRTDPSLHRCLTCELGESVWKLHRHLGKLIRWPCARNTREPWSRATPLRAPPTTTKTPPATRTNANLGPAKATIGDIYECGFCILRDLSLMQCSTMHCDKHQTPRKAAADYKAQCHECRGTRT